MPAATIPGLLALVLSVAQVPAAPPPVDAAKPGTVPGIPSPLGGYERDALARALAARGLEVDPEPVGKTVAAIHVFNLDVFGEEDGPLRLLNVFHRTTREYIIEREVLLRPGDAWDPVVAEESRRRLTDPTLSTLVVVAPVRAADPQKVGLLVVTRDVWSLRLNSDFEYQAGTFSRILLQPSENNLFGWRKTLSLVFDMDLGRYAIGPNYVDPNIHGTRMTLAAAVRLRFSRETGEAEGSSSAATAAYPFWSFKRRWGAETSWNHLDGTVRAFFGPNLFPYDAPSTPAREAIPYRYELRSYNWNASVTRAFGERFISRVSLGYDVASVRPNVFEADFAGNPEARADFVRNELPRSERTSALVAGYRLLTTDYRVLRDVDTFDLREDLNVGPQLSFVVLRGLPALGSEQSFWRLSSSAGWTLSPGGDSVIRLVGSAEGRVQESGDVIDKRYVVDLELGSPQLWKLVRLVGRARVERLVDNGRVRRLFLGGDNGLRGYAIGAFAGQAWFRGNLELRTKGLRVWFSRLGLAAFWDVGHAAPSFAEMELHHDFGVGARLLLPQLQRSVVRFDWAFADRGPTAGFPGRFSASFSQAF